MKPESFKAAIFRGVGNVDVVDLPYPSCGDDEAIVRNMMTGICGSDIFAFQKHGPESRIWIDEEFGHETISEVVELGKDVKGLKVGDRVFVNQDKAFRDPRRVSATGGFSNYLRIPQCEVGYSLLPIDNDLPLRAAVLFEPFVIGTRGVKAVNPQPGDSAIVFGAGIIGITTIMPTTPPKPPAATGVMPMPRWARPPGTASPEWPPITAMNPAAGPRPAHASTRTP